MSPSIKDRLSRCLRTAVEAVDPARLVSSALRVEGDVVVLDAAGTRAEIPLSALWKIYLVGGGKAGRAMGEAALAALGKRVADGVIAVPRGAEDTSGPVRFVAAGHPVPDIFSLAAAREILSVTERAGNGDLVVALVSGGGSAMLSSPAAGITMEEKAETFRLLLRTGADIASFNAVRKHLSEVKGGLLARAAQPSTVWALLLSDVPGDDPSVIASGPFSPDPTTFGDAIGVLERYGIFYAVPSAVRRHLSEGASGALPETRSRTIRLSSGRPPYSSERTGRRWTRRRWILHGNGTRPPPRPFSFPDSFTERRGSAPVRSAPVCGRKRRRFPRVTRSY
jgi:hydroxypyruvate reductase